MLRSLQINGVAWTVTVLGERAMLIKPETEDIELSLIHKSTEALEEAGLKNITDIIPAYDSIALIFDRLLEDTDEEVSEIQMQLTENQKAEISPQTHKVPVCYELGMDWEHVETHTGLSREEIIKVHTEAEYIVAMMGFIPGFLYLSGLDKTIACPRKSDPRTRIPAGSVGIAGHQTGIYSMESPGGWQIIGRTPDSFFDSEKDPPSEIRPGDKIRFCRIPKTEFKQMKSEQESS